MKHHSPPFSADSTFIPDIQPLSTHSFRAKLNAVPSGDRTKCKMEDFKPKSSVDEMKPYQASVL